MGGCAKELQPVDGCCGLEEIELFSGTVFAEETSKRLVSCTGIVQRRPIVAISRMDICASLKQHTSDGLMTSITRIM